MVCHSTFAPSVCRPDDVTSQMCFVAVTNRSDDRWMSYSHGQWQKCQRIGISSSRSSYFPSRCSHFTMICISERSLFQISNSFGPTVRFCYEDPQFLEYIDCMFLKYFPHPDRLQCHVDLVKVESFAPGTQMRIVISNVTPIIE